MVIDALSFARSAGALEGSLPAAQCMRLCLDLVAPQRGVFNWRAAGRMAQGHAWLDLQASGVVTVVCQRCLEPFDFELQVSNSLGLLDNAAQLEAMDALETEGRGPEQEFIVADGQLDVLVLIEDELILALPYAPHHESCTGPAVRADSEGPDPDSPFAVLARLRKH